MNPRKRVRFVIFKEVRMPQDISSAKHHFRPRAFIATEVEERRRSERRPAEPESEVGRTAFQIGRFPIIADDDAEVGLRNLSEM